MRVVVGVVSLAFFVSIGCTPVREVPLPTATGTIPDVDAWMADNDAWNVPGHDAGQPPPPDDAWSPPPPPVDMGSTSCPTYTNDVQPIYAMHCGNCHTTGGNPHFGSSYTVANQSSSSCGTSMAACTISRGMAGADMSFRDPLGGFDSSEVATIQAWITCGRPR